MNDTAVFKQRIEKIDRAYSRLREMRHFSRALSANSVDIKAKFIVGFYDEIIKKAGEQNPFFTQHMVMNAMSEIVQMMKSASLLLNDTLLRVEKLRQVAHAKDLAEDCGKLPCERDDSEQPAERGTVLIIMAGNIPMVGFHDFLCALLCGFNIVVKLSSKDSVLLPRLFEDMYTIYPPIKERVVFVTSKDHLPAYKGKIKCVLATGSSSNMANVRETFGNIPVLTRESRFSFAVLSGNESNKDLELLADDMFLYYGLGCRSVSNLFVPAGYNFDRLINMSQRYGEILVGNVWKNNYRRRKAMLQMDETPFVDGKFFLIDKRDDPWVEMSEIGVWYYNDLSDISEFEQHYSGSIQKKYINFGLAQKPGITEFADNKNSIFFLLKI